MISEQENQKLIKSKNPRGFVIPLLLKVSVTNRHGFFYLSNFYTHIKSITASDFEATVLLKIEVK